MTNPAPFSPSLRPTLDLMDAVSQGLPLSVVDRFSKEVAPNDREFRNKFVSYSTYARKRGGTKPKLSPDQAEKIVRYWRLWRMALGVFGDEAATRRFMSTGHMLLEGRTPDAVIRSGETGGRMVEDILGRLTYGAAA